LTTIGFIRHGETDWNKEHRAQGCMDIPLNSDGLRQAKAIAERISDENWDIIYASPLSRAFDTAKAIGKAANLQIVTDERLREISFGETEGTTENERLERWGPNWREIELGQETSEEADIRWKSVLQEILQKHDGQRVLIVTHGALLVRIYKDLLQDKTDRWYGITNTSLSIFKLKETLWTCERFVCKKHLEDIPAI
jgi:2,3-bisphosphoglycerate-dependent phosphoglycerate mutase